MTLDIDMSEADELREFQEGIRTELKGIVKTDVTVMTKHL